MSQLPQGKQNKLGQLYLVFNERHLDGELMNAHDMRREVMISLYKKEHYSIVEVSTELKKEMIDLLDELDAAY